MLSIEEKQQICRSYTLTCPVCETENSFFRLKRDMVRAAKAEGDGHALEYKWGKPGFDTVDPLQFYWGVCSKCRYTGELDDAEFRQAERMIKEYRANMHGEGLRDLLTSIPTGKGIASALGKRLTDSDPLVVVLAQFHLGIFCQCLRLRLVPGNLARFYLRIAWIFRDAKKYYPNSELEKVVGKFQKLRRRFKAELPDHKDYPVEPGLALNEVEALRYCRTYFERNYETLKEAKSEDELRLRLLMAEIGFRLYELTDNEDDYKVAATFFSGTMQKCLSIINDKSIVGGAVNRAKEMLEVSGERGRELRALNKSRGGAGEKVEDDAVAEESTKKKSKKIKKTVPVSADVKKSAKVKKAGDNNGNKPAAMPTPIKSGDTGDLDQATRKVAILEEQLEKMQGRLLELEEDNKKWRQLAGRDTVTGLPNKTMLFRLIVPKTLKDMKKTGPVSCIAISLDQVSKVNEGHGWVMGDRMLKESARSLRRFVAEGEELYRLDGAHFVLYGPMDNNLARQRAADIRRKLSRASLEIENTQLPLISSIGVVTVDRILSGGLAEISNSVYEALLKTLYRAKEKGGNTVEIHNITKF